MIELYTDRALRVARFSAEEARRNGRDEIGPAHLLLALARDADTPIEVEPTPSAVNRLPLCEPRSEALRVLGEFDVDAGRLAREVCGAADLILPGDLRSSGPAGVAGGHYTHDAEGAACLAGELRWASRRRNTHLSTLHKLIGTMSEKGTVAHSVLVSLGVTDLNALGHAAVCTRGERYARDQQMLRLAAADPGLEREIRRAIPGSARIPFGRRRRLRRELRANETE